jgi:Peptidase family M1 domain
MRPARNRTLLAVGTLVATLVGCSTAISGHGHPASQSRPSTSASAPAPSSSAGSGSATCPTSYAAPDPRRPKVTLRFDVSDDHSTVNGTEHVVFTPDLDITELVFRLTANTAPDVQLGNKIQVSSAKADHGGTPRYEAAGADPSTQGGLLHIPFHAKIKAGTTVTADLAFTVSIGGASFDRFGSSGNFAWFASAQPLLAWQVGFGWHTEPMIKFIAETATSEAAQTDLTVTAPGRDTVIASGNPRSVDAGNGRKLWHSTIATARDVSVAVGPFDVEDRTVDGLPVRVGASQGASADSVMSLISYAVTSLQPLFGPFPFPSLSVASLPPLPGGGGGIEYPSSILLIGSDSLVDVHETAHQWFYAMVGDSQALHAWLDEAFASYAEELVRHDPPPNSDLRIAGNVDRPTADYGSDGQDYYRVTYFKGAAALHAARAAAGPSRFDAAVRCYINANAWRIAVPSDLAEALAGLPAAVQVLKQAGALR